MQDWSKEWFFPLQEFHSFPIQIIFKNHCCSPSFGTMIPTSLFLEDRFKLWFLLTQSRMSHSSLDSVRDFFQILKNFYQKFNVQTKYGPRAGAAASSFFISGVGLVLLYFFTQIIKKKNSQRVFTRSVSIGALLGGKLAMKRLLQFQKMRANPEKKDKYLKKLDTKIESDLPDFLKLQVKHYDKIDFDNFKNHYHTWLYLLEKH